MAERDRDVFEQPSAGTVTHDEPPPAIGRGVSERRFFGHPVGLSTLFFTEMWERFSYYGIRPLLVLFMTAALVQGGFGFERATASSIVGIYAACVYLASLPGGWIADRWLGLRRSIWYGGIFIALGHLSIALSIVFAQSAFFIGLVLIVIGLACSSRTSQRSSAICIRKADRVAMQGSRSSTWVSMSARWSRR